MNDLKIPDPNVVTKPTADISLVEDEKGVVQKESFPVIPKKNNADDFVRPVKMSDLKKILSITKTIKLTKVQWDEVALGIANLGFGASISAILSNVEIKTTLGTIFYIITPIISFSSTVFVIMHKVMKHKITSYSAKTIEDIIKDYIDSENAKDSENELK